MTVQSPPRFSSAHESPDRREHRRKAAGRRDDDGQLEASAAKHWLASHSARVPLRANLGRPPTLPHSRIRAVPGTAIATLETYFRTRTLRERSSRTADRHVVRACGRRHERAKSEGRTSPDAWFLGKQERRARASSRPSRVTCQRVLPRASERPDSALLEFDQGVGEYARGSTRSCIRRRPAALLSARTTCLVGVLGSLVPLRKRGLRADGPGLASSSARCGLCQAVLVGVADGLGAVAGAGLVEDSVDVGLDGCVAEDERVCDLVVR